MYKTSNPLISTDPQVSDTPNASVRAIVSELEEKTRLLQTTLGSISQGIFMLGVDGRVSTFNDRVCELLDLPKSFP